jgi:hypothetical protein
MRKLLCAAVSVGALILAAAAPASGAIDKRTVLVKFRDGVSTSEGLRRTRSLGAIEQVSSVRRLGVAVVRVSGDPSRRA